MIIKENLHTLLLGQAETAYPEETGGLLLGKIVDGALIVEMVLPLINIREESRHNRIELDPMDYAKAERTAMKHGLGVWGFYHTHPDADAIPSEYDRQHFPFTEWWYPILSVRKGIFSEMKCWQLTDSRKDFTECIIKIVTDS
ncbi:Mov34/MPN/PAD-1 family protein [Chloroherpeton thalassium ATCC 35110]|uniref:Mov34/MPN/PAD-1 family protein n=1 Tax=Chloroherpeton thalassium (strain ATCC 35110 / GB-78) TaxID=517418 RepID=B3QSD3_CHLT3|nr:M67 family metallopeptidase [Chloroherpeton thalassium]ACF12524.1 Mov34/MPN/PAD-1 family protein [Chloroherpeton thalassium ATCC 35110]